MKFSNRELILTGLLFLFAGSAWLFVFRPRNEANAAMLTEIRDKSLLLKELGYARGAQSRKLQEELAGLDRAVKVMRTRLPREHRHDVILLGLWQRALSNRIWIHKFGIVMKVSNNVDLLNNPYSNDIFEVTVSGHYLDFYTFLQALENWPRVIRIDTIEITKKPMITKDYAEQMSPTLHGQITARLQLRFFWGDKE